MLTDPALVDAVPGKPRTCFVDWTYHVILAKVNL